jgi:hypothetical protein
MAVTVVIACTFASAQSKKDDQTMATTVAKKKKELPKILRTDSIKPCLPVTQKALGVNFKTESARRQMVPYTFKNESIMTIVKQSIPRFDEFSGVTFGQFCVNPPLNVGYVFNKYQ